MQVFEVPARDLDGAAGGFEIVVQEQHVAVDVRVEVAVADVRMLVALLVAAGVQAVSHEHWVAAGGPAVG